MKRNPIFIYNNIDKQNLVYANQLTVKQWNDIVNKLTAQANANTAFLETWTRWFFGPVEYTTEDEYTDSLGTYDSYYDYLKAEFNRIDTHITAEATRLDGRINEEKANRESQDNILSDRIDINANDIVAERDQRISQDNIIHDRIDVVNQRVATEEDNRMAEIDRLEGDDKAIRDSIVQENINWNAADRNLQEQITDNKNTKLNRDLSNLPFASRVHNDDFLVIRCACDGAPATQKISIKVLAELINSEVDYFKGVYADYNSLVSAHPVGEPGDYALVGSSDDSLFIQYVWDDKANEGQGVWEETTSTQFVLPEVFSAHQQDLQEGKFVVGKSVISTTAESTSYYTDPDNPTMPKVDIKDLVPKPLEIEVRDEFSNAQGAGTMKELVIGGDIWRVPSDVTSIVFSSIPAEGDSYELRTITINGEKWQIPEGSKLDSELLTLELSSERQEGANELGSIRIGDDVWNMPQSGSGGGGIKKITFTDRVSLYGWLVNNYESVIKLTATVQALGESASCGILSGVYDGATGELNGFGGNSGFATVATPPETWIRTRITTITVSTDIVSCVMTTIEKDGSGNVTTENAILVKFEDENWSPYGITVDVIYFEL